MEDLKFLIHNISNNGLKVSNDKIGIYQSKCDIYTKWLRFNLF